MSISSSVASSLPQARRCQRSAQVAPVCGSQARLGWRRGRDALACSAPAGVTATGWGSVRHGIQIPKRLGAVAREALVSVGSDTLRLLARRTGGSSHVTLDPHVRHEAQ